MRSRHLRAFDSLIRFAKMAQSEADRRKQDPYHPVPRSKGEKARNRRKRGQT